MDINSLVDKESVDFTGMEIRPFLLGLLSAFDNRYQACADKFFGQVTWKQFFTIISITLCNGNPTINELSAFMGTSHQNVKQILLKLEKIGFVEMIKDNEDKRKQRILLTQKCKEFCDRHEEGSDRIIAKIFEGIDEEDILVTIKTIIEMAKNVNQL